MHLIYLIDIFEDNYNIAHDRFETDPANVMKNRLVVAKKQRKFQYISALLSLSQNHEDCHYEQQHSNRSYATMVCKTLEKCDDLEKYRANTTFNL